MPSRTRYSAAVTRSRALATVAACLVAVLPLAGCYQGFEGTVSTQSPSGNGTDFEVGDLKVQDATLVTDPEDPTAASLIMTIVNEGETDDTLVSAEVGTSAGSTEGPIAVPAGAAVAVGSPEPGSPSVAFLGLTTAPGEFAPVTLRFTTAGSTPEPVEVAVVVGEGYYADYAPSIDRSEQAE
jgi:copper(I)-binding protein